MTRGSGVTQPSVTKGPLGDTGNPDKGPPGKTPGGYRGGVDGGMGGRISPLLPCLEFVLLYSPLLFFLPVFFLSMNPVCLPVIVAPYLFWLAAIAASCFTASVSTVVSATGLALSLLLLAAVANSSAAAQRKLLTPVTVLTAVVTCEYTRTIYNA